MRWCQLQTTQPNDRWERNCEIVELRDQGLTLRALGKRYGLCHHRVDQIIHMTRRKQQRWLAENYWGA